MTFEKFHQFDLAHEMLRKFRPESYESKFKIGITLARLYRKMRQYKNAINLLQALEKEDQSNGARNSLAIKLCLLVAYQCSGQTQNATSLCTSLMHEFPDQPSVALTVANYKIYVKEYDEAITTLTDLKKHVTPRYAEDTDVMLADCYRNTQQHHKARDILKTINSPKAIEGLALCYANLHDDKALALLYRREIKEKPTPSSSKLYFGYIEYLYKIDPRQALQECEKAVKVFPYSEILHERLCFLFFRNNRDWITKYDSTCQKFPRHLTVHG